MSNATFHKGQILKIRFRECVNGHRVIQKERPVEILELYKHFALCRVRGSRWSFSYWELEKAMRGEVIDV